MPRYVKPPEEDLQPRYEEYMSPMEGAISKVDRRLGISKDPINPQVFEGGEAFNWRKPVPPPEEGAPMPPQGDMRGTVDPKILDEVRDLQLAGTRALDLPEEGQTGPNGSSERVRQAILRQYAMHDPPRPLEMWELAGLVQDGVVRDPNLAKQLEAMGVLLPTRGKDAPLSAEERAAMEQHNRDLDAYEIEQALQKAPPPNPDFYNR